MFTSRSGSTDARPIGERLIAVGRIAMAASSVVALYFDPTSPQRFWKFALQLLVAYLVFAAIVAVPALRRERNVPAWLGLGAHVVDVAVVAVLMYVSTGTSSPFFVFFTFAMAVATIRWQTPGLIVTASVAVLVLIALTVMAVEGKGGWTPEFELNRTIVRGTYLIVIASILAYFGRVEHRRQREIATLAAWPRDTAVDLSGMLKANLRQAAETLHATRVILVWEDADEPWIELAEWTGSELRMRREPPEALTPTVAPEVASVDFLTSDASSASARVVRATADGHDLWRGLPIHADLVRRFAIGPVMGLRVQGDLMTGRLLLATPSASSDDFVVGRIVAQRIADALDLFLFGRRVADMAVLEERTQLSHELHDGALQALAGVAYKLQTAERALASNPDDVRTAMQEIQRYLEEEQRDIRFYMNGLRRPSSGWRNAGLDAQLKQLTERVESVWNIKVNTTVDVQNSPMTAGQEHELFRIAQEAVVNAARHGGADEVGIAITGSEAALRMVVTDNGRGFPFEGAYDDAALAEQRIGPVVLKARVKALGGELAIESDEQGARLDVFVPLKRPRRSNP